MLPTIKDCVRRFVLLKNYVHVRRHKKQLWIEHTGAVSGLADSASWDKCLKVWQALECMKMP
uniref:Uncharacterized protein n=1 Tax=Nelumbo nucifera TaxID=4432 RepID=A0A822Y1S2_NELNU|nr:TPA_asm: hypothetical protein HUJ06_026489 [Nelumbo nucifera]